MKYFYIYRNMKQFDELQNNIEELQNKGYKTEFDIDKYMLSEDEVVKKILLTKNPYMTKEQANLIIDSIEKSISKIDEEISKKEKLDDSIKKDKDKVSNKLTKEERQKKREDLKKKIKKEITETKEYYKDKLKEYYREAKEIKKEVKNAIYQIIKEVKALAKKVIMSAIQAVNSIAAITVVIAAPPWNIPLAISYALAVVDIFMNLISKITSMIPFLKPLDKLIFTMDDKNITKISGVLNKVIKTILGFWDVVMSYETIIKKLIESLLKLLSGNKAKIFRKATRKLRKLGYFKQKNQNYDVDRNGYLVKANSEEDAEEVMDILDTFVVDYNRELVVDYKQKIDEDILKNLNSNEEPIIPLDIIEDISQYAYDVKLPDGTILYNVSESYLEDLKNTYTVIINQVSDINRQNFRN